MIKDIIIADQFRMSLTPNKIKKRSSALKTSPSTVLVSQKNKYHHYDNSNFHKTIFHLKPLRQNPQIFTKSTSINAKKLFTKLNGARKGEIQKQKREEAILPHPIAIRKQLTRLSGLQKNLEKLLTEENMSHVTAKKWLIYDMENNYVIKGYKYKKPHDVASVSKIMTFYTAHSLIQKYFISIDKTDMIVEMDDAILQGTRINLKDEDIVTLQDMLYAMLLNSANNAATTIANNLGNFLIKKKAGKYFSCFDVPKESRGKNIEAFMDHMHSLTLELKLTDSDFLNPHGMCQNTSSAIDIAKIASECFKIPLFSKIVSTIKHQIFIKFINEEGDYLSRPVLLLNSNKLLGTGSGCIGGKTGCNNVGGESFIGCYEGTILVVVLGSAGREEKFADCERLMAWLKRKLVQYNYN